MTCIASFLCGPDCRSPPRVCALCSVALSLSKSLKYKHLNVLPKTRHDSSPGDSTSPCHLRLPLLKRAVKTRPATVAAVPANASPTVDKDAKCKLTPAVPKRSVGCSPYPSVHVSGVAWWGVVWRKRGRWSGVEWSIEVKMERVSLVRRQS